MSFIRRMWGFTFPLIDVRLMGLGGFFFGLMLAKLWVRLVLVSNYCFGAFNKIYNNFFQTSLIIGHP